MIVNITSLALNIPEEPEHRVNTILTISEQRYTKGQDALRDGDAPAGAVWESDWVRVLEKALQRAWDQPRRHLAGPLMDFWEAQGD